MAHTDTANAINHVANHLGLVSFSISAVFMAAIYFSRTAARRRLLLRAYMVVLFIAIFCFIPPFVHAGYGAIDIGFMLGASLLILGLNLRFTTFCESCTRPVSKANRPWMRITHCPHCGAQLPKAL